MNPQYLPPAELEGVIHPLWSVVFALALIAVVTVALGLVEASFSHAGVAGLTSAVS